MAEDSAKRTLAQRMQMRQMDRSMAKAADNREEEKIYSNAITDFLRENGRIICISDDRELCGLLRSLVTERLKMPVSCLLVADSADMVVRILRDDASEGRRPLLLMEETLRSRSMAYVIRLLKNGFPAMAILLLCRDSSQQKLALLHESGASGFIVRPVDMRGLLEKIAGTVRPQGQVERQLDWARQLLSQGDHLKALAVCQQALEQKSGSSAVLMLIGDIYKAMKEPEKAAEAYGNASRGSARFIEPLRRLADLYTETGDKQKQLQYLEKLDEISPLNVERKLAMGELYLSQNRADSARKLFQDAVNLSDREATDYASGVARRAADICTPADPQSAAQFLRRNLEMRKAYWGPEDLPTFNKLGILLRRAGKWREAAEEYRKALGVAPNDEILHYNLGMAYLEGEDPESARGCALKALALNPDLPRKSSVISCNLATIFMRTNDKMHALPLLRAALEQDPGNIQARELMEKAGGAQGEV